MTLHAPPGAYRLKPTAEATAAIAATVCRGEMGINRAALVAALAALSAGCAVQPGRNGAPQFSLDEAALFGQVVQSFTLPDGSEARLRVAAGRHSLKLERQMRVIPVDNALTAEVHSVHTVGNRTVIVLTKSTSACPYQNQVIAWRGSEALSWDTGDCRHAPAVRLTAGTLALDYPQDNGGAQRFVYQDGRLDRGTLSAAQVAALAPAAGAAPGNAAVVPPQAQRYVPGLPAAPAAGAPAPSAAVAPPDRRTAATAPSADRPAVRPVAAAVPVTAPAAPPRPSRPLDFQAQEQKPVRIILDK